MCQTQFRLLRKHTWSRPFEVSIHIELHNIVHFVVLFVRKSLNFSIIFVILLFIWSFINGRWTETGRKLVFFSLFTMYEIHVFLTESNFESDIVLSKIGLFLMKMIYFDQSSYSRHDAWHAMRSHRCAPWMV